MSESIEIEFKNLLVITEYEQLVREFSFTQADFYTQTNYYFDTSDHELRKKQLGLRIRLLPTKAEYTLKSPLKTGLLETTEVLTVKQANELLTKQKLPQEGPVAQKLKEFSIVTEQLLLIGSLTTKRAEKSVQNNNLIVLDENWYGSIHDYELEIEVCDSQSGEAYFSRFLKNHHIPRRRTKNKVVRMMENIN